MNCNPHSRRSFVQTTALAGAALTVGLSLSAPPAAAATRKRNLKLGYDNFAVRAMTEEDRRAIYRFVHSLGAAGQPAPEALPPGQTPPAPYLGLVLPAPTADAPAAH